MLAAHKKDPILMESEVSLPTVRQRFKLNLNCPIHFIYPQFIYILRILILFSYFYPKSPNFSIALTFYKIVCEFLISHLFCVSLSFPSCCNHSNSVRLTSQCANMVKESYHKYAITRTEVWPLNVQIAVSVVNQQQSADPWVFLVTGSVI
jgi:hypothetical protein